MKNLVKITEILIILLLFINCEDNNINDEKNYSSQSKSLNDFFYFNDNKHYKNANLYHDIITIDNNYKTDSLLNEKIDFSENIDKIIGFDMIIDDLENDYFKKTDIKEIFVYYIQNNVLKFGTFNISNNSYVKNHEHFKINNYNLNNIYYNLNLNPNLNIENDTLFIKTFINLNKIEDFSTQGDAYKVFKLANFLDKNDVPSYDPMDPDEPVITDPGNGSGGSGFCQVFFPDCNGTGDCVKDGTLTYKCEGSFCGKAQLKSASLIENISQNLINNTLIENDSLHYDFKDNYLNNSRLGNKYKDYYYAMSRFLDVPDYVDIAINTGVFNLIPEVDDKLEILTQNGNENTVIFTEDFTSDLIQFLDNIKNSNGSHFERVVEDLQNDILFFEGKSKSELNLIFN